MKGVKFKNHQDAGNPASTVQIFNDQMADEIIVCDIDAQKACWSRLSHSKCICFEMFCSYLFRRWYQKFRNGKESDFEWCRQGLS